MQIYLSPSRKLSHWGLKLVCGISALCSLTAFAETMVSPGKSFRDKFISLGTATPGGTAYGIGQQLCQTINARRSSSEIRCVPYVTTGFEYNVKAVSYGSLPMGLTSSSILQNEYQQRGDGLMGNRLRVVMTLYPMPIVIIARRASHIADASEIRGHSINLGNPGSGLRTMADTLLRVMRLEAGDFSKVSELSSQRAANDFCEGKVDMIMQNLGHPSSLYKRLIDQCDGEFVKFPEAMTKSILASEPRMIPLQIPGGIYQAYPKPLSAFGYTAVLVTSKEVSSEAVRRFVSSVDLSLPDLQRDAPVLREMNNESMFRPIGSVPFHQGVIDYITSRSE